jgi:hypothetical protein
LSKNAGSGSVLNQSGSTTLIIIIIIIQEEFIVEEEVESCSDVTTSTAEAVMLTSAIENMECGSSFHHPDVNNSGEQPTQRSGGKLVPPSFDMFYAEEEGGGEEEAAGGDTFPPGGDNLNQEEGSSSKSFRGKNKRTVAAVSAADRSAALTAMEELRSRGATTEDLVCRLCAPPRPFTAYSTLLTHYRYTGTTQGGFKKGERTSLEFGIHQEQAGRKGVRRAEGVGMSRGVESKYIRVVRNFIT